MADQTEFDYDVFISYSHADKAWVRGELLKRLDAAGLHACIDFRDFRPGGPTNTAPASQAQRVRSQLAELGRLAGITFATRLMEA
jgi:hypothetical protein